MREKESESKREIKKWFIYSVCRVKHAVCLCIAEFYHSYWSWKKEKQRDFQVNLFMWQSKYCKSVRWKKKFIVQDKTVGIRKAFEVKVVSRHTTYKQKCWFLGLVKMRKRIAEIQYWFHLPAQAQDFIFWGASINHYKINVRYCHFYKIFL